MEETNGPPDVSAQGHDPQPLILAVPGEILDKIFRFVSGGSLTAEFTPADYRDILRKPGFSGTWEWEKKGFKWQEEEDRRARLQDLRNLRLTCRQFCLASSRYLVPVIAVDMTEASLARLDRISRHPHISVGVRAVRAVLHLFDRRRAETVEQFRPYARQIIHGMADDLPVPDPSEDTLPGVQGESNRAVRRAHFMRDAWAPPGAPSHAWLKDKYDKEEYLDILRRLHYRYQQNYEEQQSLLKDNRFSRRIGEAMRRMPGARQLELYDMHARRRKPTIEEAMLDERVLFDIVTSEGNNWGESQFWRDTLPILSQLVQLPLAVHAADVNLTALSLRIHPPAELSPLKLALTEENQHMLAAATRYVRRAEVKLLKKGGVVSRFNSETSGFESIQTYLSCILKPDGLESLDIVLSQPEDSVYIDAFGGVAWTWTLTAVLPSLVWPKLKRLKINRYALHMRELADLLQGLHQPLEFLWLDRVELQSGSWAKVLDIMREKAIADIFISRVSGAESMETNEGGKQTRPEVDEIFETRSGAGTLSAAEQYVSGQIALNPILAAGIDQLDASV